MTEVFESVAYRGRVAQVGHLACNARFSLGMGSWSCIYICDPDGYLAQYNRRAAELWGQSPDVDDRQHRLCGAYRAFTARAR